MARSEGVFAPMMLASVGRKSWIETISLFLPGAILPGHLMIPGTRIEPSRASPNSPLNGPLLPPRYAGGPLIGVAPLSESQITMVLSSTPASSIALRISPVRASSSMIASP